MAGAVAIRASTWAGSRRTRRVDRSTDAPAPANASRTRSPRTSTPISARIRSDATWIASRWSADRISSGRNGLTSRRHGSWASPGAARRGRRRGPSCGSAASGVVPSGVVRGSSTTGCYGPPIRRRHGVLRGAAATRGSGSPATRAISHACLRRHALNDGRSARSSAELRPSVGHGRRHETQDPRHRRTGRRRHRCHRRRGRRPADHVRLHHPVPDRCGDDRRRHERRRGDRHGRAERVVRRHLRGARPSRGGHDERRIDDLDRHGPQGQGRRHGQEGPGPRDRRHRGPQAPAGRREHRGRHRPDRPAGSQGEPVRRERRERDGADPPGQDRGQQRRDPAVVRAQDARRPRDPDQARDAHLPDRRHRHDGQRRPRASTLRPATRSSSTRRRST